MKKILIVEDDIELAESVKMFLEDEGYQVDWIIDYTALADKLKNSRPDLILLDYLLPKKDGITIAKLIRSDLSYKDLPIVMVAATQNIKKEAIRFGINEFVEKPFDIDKLLNVVGRYIQKTAIQS